MAPVEEPMNQDHETMSNKPVIGIIYPPPEVRNIVDKTASFVARNGPEFETRIRQNELNNPKFNFLTSTDPYHAYYQHKVKEFSEGHAVEPIVPKPMGSLLGISHPRQEQIKIVAEPTVPKEPPPEHEFIADPPSISAFDLDVVKLTAQFVARNGRQFLTNLMNREKNYQFDFLRPQHSLFNYFTKLVEQYTKVLIPPKDLPPKLRKEAENPRDVLEQVKTRVEWAKYQDMQKRKEEEALERERVAYASIDWHDFVVVETVDFSSTEPGNFPPPTTPEEVGARLLAQERYVSGGPDQTVEMEVESSEDEDEDEDEDESEEEEKSDKEDEEMEKVIPPPPPPSRPPVPTAAGDDTQVQDMEEDSDEEDSFEPPRRAKSPQPPPLPPPPPADLPQPPPLPPQPDQVVIRDYNPKAPKTVLNTPAPDKLLVSPITGEKIPVDKLQEHIRIGLLDPKWIEQRDRNIAERREQEDVYAAGSSIGGNLKLLAERRTDIFGSGAEEAQIGKKIGEEEKRTKEKVTWDGHTASMERVTQKARENISIEEQIADIHKAKGLLPDEEKEKIGPAMPKNAPPPRPPPPRPAPPPPPQPPQQPHPPVPPPPPPQPMLMQQRMMMMQPRPPMPPMRPQQHMMGMPPRGPMSGPPHMGPPPMGMGPPGGFMPPGMGPPGMAGPPGAGPVGMPPRPPMGDDDGPPSKKAKTEDDLMPEQEFLRRNKGPVQFKVAVPNMPDKAEWKLNGQILGFTLPLTDAVSVIKAKLHEELGMPAGKQKLQHEGLFIKDSNSLAFYNFNRGSIVQLQLKERGGRKK